MGFWQKFALSATLVFGVFFCIPVLGQTTDHLVISQVQIDSVDGVGGTYDDFVEIYNPTPDDVDVEGWSIQKVNKTGGSHYRKKLTGTIPAYGFFLIVRNHSETDDELVAKADVLAAGSSFSLSDHNTIYLVNDNEDVLGIDDENVVDFLGMGEAENYESQAIENPADGGSLERLPGSGEGNGQDTNHNRNDFFQQSIPHPRNSQSEPETAEAESDPDEDGDETESEEADDSEKSEPVEQGGGFNLAITEIAPNPDGRDSGNEWVELYNAGSGTIDLSGWLLDDAGDQDVPGSSAYQIEEGVVLEGFEYISFTIPSGYFALNNSGGDALRVFDNEKNLRLQKYYPNSSKQGYSYAVDDLGNWDWTGIVTPGEENEFGEIIVFSDQIRINEVLPNPFGSDSEGEFIELYNYGSDAVDLSGWIVADARKKYVISEDDFFETEIPSKGYFVVYREVSGISLNNSGTENVVLYSPDEQEVSALEYDGQGHGNDSLIWVGNKKYSWTIEHTPGEENVLKTESIKETINDPEDTSGQSANATNEAEKDFGSQSEEDDLENVLEIDLEEVRELEEGILVKTKGIVSTPPGIFGDDVLYLAGSGIRVFFENGVLTKLDFGDEIEVVGLTDSYHNETQLRIKNDNSVKVLSSENEPPVYEVQTGDIGERHEGFLVKIKGEVTKNQGNTFFVDDGSGEARVTIQDATKIVKPSIRKGDQIVVLGVVSQFNQNYRLLPRYQEDIGGAKVLGENTLPRTGSNFWLIYAVFVLVSGLFVFILLLNKRKTC